MKNFNDIYEEIYKKSYNVMEEKRKAEQLRKILVSVLIIGIAIIILLLSNNTLQNSWLALLILSLLALIYIITPSKNTHYNIAYKQLVINNLIEGYDTNLEYKPNRGISSNIYTMGEFENFDRYFSEDYIYGKLNNKNILMAEVTTERKERDRNGRTYYVTIFQGLFAKVDLIKTINSTTRIRKNKFKIFNHINLEMDSGEFERIFDVYSNGKIETMQILTLDTMQHIIDFVNQTKLIPEFTIKENCIYIRFLTPILTINNNENDVFEANPFKNSLDYEELKKYFDILNFIETITDEILKNIEEAGI